MKRARLERRAERRPLRREVAEARVVRHRRADREQAQDQAEEHRRERVRGDGAGGEERVVRHDALRHDVEHLARARW
jgi:hypothetical protein